MEDLKIVDLYWSRAEGAITETASKYGRYCYTIAYNILYDAGHADESVNDTYLGAWNSMPPHRPTILATFLGKITRRISLKKWRDMHRDKRGGDEVALALDELQDCVPSTQDVEQVIDAAELERIINTFIVALPELEQRVFVCRYWYLDPILEICMQFNFSESKVKSILYRTRNKLMLHLQKEGVWNER